MHFEKKIDAVKIDGLDGKNSKVSGDFLTKFNDFLQNDTKYCMIKEKNELTFFCFTENLKQISQKMKLQN